MKCFTKSQVGLGLVTKPVRITPAFEFSHFVVIGLLWFSTAKSADFWQQKWNIGKMGVILTAPVVSDSSREEVKNLENVRTSWIEPLPFSPFPFPRCRCNRQKSVSAEMGSSSAIPGQRESDALPQFFGKQKDGKEEGISKSN